MTIRIVILCDSLPKSMGYATTQLPKALAKLGADVHYVTSGLHPYITSIPNVREIYGDFTPDSAEAGVIERYEGYTVHYLPYKMMFGYVRMQGVSAKLAEVKPDIVQTFNTINWPPLDGALNQRRLGYKLFTGNHTTVSTFPLAQQSSFRWQPARIKNTLTREICGRFVSMYAEKCYAATVDCAEVAARFFGVPAAKVEVIPLGVDTETFFPPSTPELVHERIGVREALGLHPEEILCIYTGRFTPDKNPLLLAKAVESLASQGQPYRSLFFGDGAQADAIAQCAHATVRKFVPFSDLAKYYRAADIGVWPTQESTSMLDAAACGLPIVVNHTLRAVERIQGNGVRYKLNDLRDLVRVLAELGDAVLRRKLGAIGAQRMLDHFSWRSLAQRRLEDYERALRPTSNN